MFAIYAPTTIRSIVNAKGTFVPQVPAIVNWSLLKAETKGLAVIMPPLLLTKGLQKPFTPPDNNVLAMLPVVKVPCRVKELPII